MSKKECEIEMSLIWLKFMKAKYPFEAHISEYSEYFAGMHKHDYPQLFYCLEGCCDHMVGDETYQCEAGDLIIIPPGVGHSFSVYTRCVLVQTNVLLNFFDNPASHAQLPAVVSLFLPQFSDKVKFSPKMHISFRDKEKEIADSVFRKLSKLEWRKHVSDIFAARNLFCSIFVLSPFVLEKKTLTRAERFIPEKYIPILRTIYYMNLNFRKKIRVDDLVELSGFCRTEYFKYVKKFLGMSYSSYLSLVRVGHASVLCKFSKYSFSYIADICGFSDHSHMDVNMAKYNNGVTPTDMRKGREINIINYPYMIMSRDEYEENLPFFYHYGTESEDVARS